MKNEQLKELAAVLDGIADGREWQFEGGSHLAEPTWFDASPKDSPLTLLGNMGRKIRLKPDPFEPFRQALLDGKTVESFSISNGWLRWQGGEDFGDRKAENFRIKSEPQKAQLSMGDVPPGSVIRSSEAMWFLVISSHFNGVFITARKEIITWDELLIYWQIWRPTDTGWQPCWKEVAP
jgi:hypothetical protein